MNRYLNLSLLGAAAALTLASCGGGGGGSPVAGTTPTSAPNTAPVIGKLASSQTIFQGGSGELLTLAVSDAESPASDLKVTVESSDEAVIPSHGILLGGAGGERTLSLTPQPGAYGTARVTAVVTDPSGLSTRHAVAVTVASEERSFREFVGNVMALPSNGEPVRAEGYRWIDRGTDDPAAFIEWGGGN